MTNERTFVLVKPDGVQRGLMGSVFSRFESRGLKIVAMRMLRLDRETVEEYYKEHIGKDFFEDLVDFIASGPVVAMVIEGPMAVSVVRGMVGATDPKEAAPGTIRGDFGLSKQMNIIHASDSPDSARREIPIFFGDDEIQDFERIDEPWTR
ncbi:MAG: nucleoside-diphosphate kinase [Thermoplasmata archaeon]